MPIGPSDLDNDGRVRFQTTLDLVLYSIDSAFLDNCPGFVSADECRINCSLKISLGVFEEVQKIYLNAGWKSVLAIGRELDEGYISTIIFRK